MERECYDILNPDTGVVTTVPMSQEEAFRCSYDAEFAMQVIASYNSTKESNSEIAATQPHQETPASENTIYRWKESNIYLLLNVYEELQDKFVDPKISQKKAWLLVADEANKRNSQFNVTGLQCMTKMRALKKAYKSVKDHNSKSGNDRRTWKYFEKMQEIFGMRAWATPIALVSSDQPPESPAVEASTSNMTRVDQPLPPTCTRSRGTYKHFEINSGLMTDNQNSLMTSNIILQ